MKLVQCLFVITLYFLSIDSQAKDIYDNKFHKINGGTFNFNQDYYSLFGQYHDSLVVVMPNLEISLPVMVKEYKKMISFLSSKENSHRNALSPERTVFPDGLFDVFWNRKKYSEFPVIGLNWFQACMYCHYLDLTDNDTNFYYRLPYLPEYFQFINGLSNDSIGSHKFNKPWLWTINFFSEELESKTFLNNSSMNLLSVRLSSKNDHKSFLRRVVIVQNEGIFKSGNPRGFLTFYADKGYANVGFCVVRKSKNDNKKEYVNFVKFYNTLLKEIFN